LKTAETDENGNKTVLFCGIRNGKVRIIFLRGCRCTYFICSRV